MKDHLQQSATDLIPILSTLPPSKIPSLTSGYEFYNTVLEIENFLKEQKKHPTYRRHVIRHFARVAMNYYNKIKMNPNTTTNKKLPNLIPLDEFDDESESE